MPVYISQLGDIAASQQRYRGHSASNETISGVIARSVGRSWATAQPFLTPSPARRCKCSQTQRRRAAQAPGRTRADRAGRSCIADAAIKARFPHPRGRWDLRRRTRPISGRTPAGPIRVRGRPADPPACPSGGARVAPRTRRPLARARRRQPRTTRPPACSPACHGRASTSRGPRRHAAPRNVSIPSARPPSVRARRAGPPVFCRVRLEPGRWQGGIVIALRCVLVGGARDLDRGILSSCYCDAYRDWGARMRGSREPPCTGHPCTSVICARR